MTLYFDRRLRRFVTVPGLDGTLETLTFKAGDVEEVVVQFGQSPDGAAPNSVVSAPTWTAENLGAGALIDIGIKASGDYSDGDLLAGTSTYVHDSDAKTYTFNLSLNTTEINNALERIDADDTNDVASIDDCLFELTYKYSAGADYQSSIDDVVATIKHDVLSGSEGTPVNAADPDEYSLISNTIQFLDTVTSQTGGTSADLDSVATVSRTVGEVVSFLDADNADAIRLYYLASGTDAENAPDVIRPDDYAASTNEKVWKLRTLNTGSNDYLLLSQTGTGGLTSQTWTKRSLVESVDTAAICTISSGGFQLPVGDYRVRGYANAYNCGHNYLRIQNITAATTAVEGLEAYAQIAPTETETITCVADTAGSLDGTYFILHDEDGSVAFWIDVDDSGTAQPTLTVDRYVEITGIATGDSATAVATAVASAIDGDSKFSASAASNVVTVTHGDDSPQYPGFPQTAGFTFAVTGYRGTGDQTTAHIVGRFSVTSATDVYELQHFSRFTQASDGQGSNFISALGNTAKIEIEQEK